MVHIKHTGNRKFLGLPYSLEVLIKIKQLDVVKRQSVYYSTSIYTCSTVVMFVYRLPLRFDGFCNYLLAFIVFTLIKHTILNN